MRTSESTDQLVGAMALARGDFSQVKKNQVNTFLRTRYADQASIYDATTQELSNNGLIILSGAECLDGDMILVTTRLAHCSGQWIETSIKIPVIEEKGTNRLQAIGRSLAYGVRYNTSNILGVAGEDDGDGQSQDTTRSERTAEEREPEGPVVARRPKLAQPKAEAKSEQPAQSRNEVLFHIQTRLAVLVRHRTDDEARHEKMEFCKAAFGGGIDSWAMVTQLQLSALKNGLLRLNKMGPLEEPPAVPPAQESMAPSGSPGPGEESVFVGTPPEVPAIARDGYVEPLQVDALALYAEAYHAGKIFVDILHGCPGFPDHPKVTPAQYVHCLTAIEWAMKQPKKADDADSDADPEEEGGL